MTRAKVTVRTGETGHISVLLLHLVLGSGGQAVRSREGGEVGKRQDGAYSNDRGMWSPPGPTGTHVPLSLPPGHLVNLLI